LNAELIAITTEKSRLPLIDASKKVLLGGSRTKGLGTGGNPEIGEQVAQMAYRDLYKMMDGADMVFVLAGLGGGTGSGAGPVVAEVAKEVGALVISMVTMPFKVEGKKRWTVAEHSVERFRDNSHTVIVMDNNRLLEIAKKYDVTLSLGDGMRPGCIADATDRCQIEELITLGELVDRAREADVQAMVEGPGHVPLDQIEANILLQKKLCHGAPFYVLGPIVTDVAPGYDHITGAIGGAIAAKAGADFLCSLCRGCRGWRERVQNLDYNLSLPPCWVVSPYCG